MAAFVRVSGPPNSSFLVGYPGIPATLPRIEGKVEIRPSSGISAPVSISLVKISLQRCETIHPVADSLTKKRLGAPRKEFTELVGPEMILFQCSPGKDYENVFSMDLPFALFMPTGKEGQSAARKVPPASIQLPNRTAETYYEMVVIVVQQSYADQNKYAFPVPISRYDTLSTFGMYNQPKSAEGMTDYLVTLGITLPRLSYGPLDPINASITLSPNANWPRKSKRVAIKSITIAIEEEIIYNHEGDEPQRKVKTIEKSTQMVGVKLPDDGYFTNMALIFPSKEIRDSDGIIPRGKPGFPMYSVNAFTTTGSLYKIEYFIAVKAHLSSAKDITVRQSIVVCHLDHFGCADEMDAIEQAAKSAAKLTPDNPMLPAPTIVRPNDDNALHPLGMTMHHRDHMVIVDSSLVTVPVNFKNGGISSTTFLALLTWRNPSHSLERGFLGDKAPIEEY